MKEHLVNFFKGMAMGAANVIPGVSGGTVALITGIFERFIDSLKSFDLKAIQLLIKGSFKELLKHTDAVFLISILAGAFVSVVSFAKVLEYLFNHYPILIWAFFFGLIMASVYFVGKTVQRWSINVLISFFIGTIIAVIISFMEPASENDGFVYLIVCGVVAICSMILPGLSGSYVLLLMGNYELVIIRAVGSLDIAVLFPVAIGAGGGLIGFSHLLSWVYKRFRDQTIAVLTGFILGSLLILWPWKETIYRLTPDGNLLIKDGEKVVQGYEQILPEMNSENIWAIGLIILGIFVVWGMEKIAAKSTIQNA